MPALSGMQRSIINYQPIVPILALLGLVLYESIFSIYVYITPLAGYVFLYIVQNYENKEKRWLIFALFLYLCYFEINRGFFVFSSLILFMFYYKFFHHELISFMACQSCIKGIIIAIYYIGFYLINLFLDLIFNHPLPKFDISYIIFIISDFMVVLL